MKKLLGLREGESRTVLFLMAYLTLLCFGTSLGIAIATSMLLAEVGADKLPFIFVGISFAALCFSSVYPVLLNRKGSRYICRLYAISGFLCILICNTMIRFEWILAGVNVGVFLQYLAFFVLLGWDIMHFGNYCQTILNPLQRKRLYGLILSATKLGGILGGLCLGPLIQWLGQINVLLIWALAYLVSGLILVLFETQLDREAKPSKRIRSAKSLGILQSLLIGFNTIIKNSFLGFFAIVIALDICTGSLMVFQFNEGLGQIYAGRGEELSTFLGQFTAASNGVALILQVFLAPRLTASLGVGWVNFFYPLFSLLILGISLARWDLLIVCVLMFHKDYLSSVVHMPNRALFYNAVAPEQRTFILGFLEGTWTHCVNLIFGVILVIIVQLGPQTTDWFESGFSKIFSIAGVIFFAHYILIAFQLKKHYGLQLLSIIKQDDPLAKIRNFSLNLQEIQELEAAHEGQLINYMEFLSGDLKDELERVYHQAEAAEQWSICMLHPLAMNDYHQQISANERWDLFLKICPEKLSSQFQVDMNAAQLIELFEHNYKKQKLIKTLMHYCLIFSRSEIVEHMDRNIQKIPKTLLTELCDLGYFFELSLSSSACEYLLSEGFQSSVENQSKILRGISASAHSDVIPRLVMFFGLASQKVRKLVVEVTLQIARNAELRQELQNTYFDRDWPYHARLTWFSLFEEFPADEREVLLRRILSTERYRLLALTQLKTDLESLHLSATDFLEAVNEEIRYQCNFLLVYFRNDFDKISLEIVRKALFENHSTRRYEAIELLSNTGKNDICLLLLPFLEFNEGQHLLNSLKEVEGMQAIKPGLENGIDYCLNGPDQWLRAVALEWISEHKLVEYLAMIEALPDFKDLISGEMLLYCKNRLKNLPN